ncbi:MAG: mechanosensitive ion channel [Chromatiales bacterium]|nr:mechanosensitive ion channel [Chromatiales bacterium]
MDVENIDKLLAQAQILSVEFGLKIVTALAIFIIGKWVARKLGSAVTKLLEKGSGDPMLVRFVGNIVYFALLTFVILAAIAQMGVQTTSFVAALGAAGFAVGLALQGSLGNFAAGILLLVFRPFRVGHFIEGAGTAGTVEEVHIFNTRLRTPDNKSIVIPNSQLTSGTITNFTAKSERRVDLTFGVSYSDDIDKVKAVIREVMAEDDRILPEPEPVVGLMTLGESSVDFVVRPWVKSENYWPVLFDLNERMKKRFDAEGISIPFPQRDVHIIEKAKI